MCRRRRNQHDRARFQWRVSCRSVGPEAELRPRGALLNLVGAGRKPGVGILTSLPRLVSFAARRHNNGRAHSQSFWRVEWRDELISQNGQPEARELNHPKDPANLTPKAKKPFDVSSKGFKVKQSGGQYTHRTILGGRWGVGRGFGSSTVTRHELFDPLIFMASGDSTVPAFDRSTCETPRRKHSDSCNRPVVRPL